MKRRRLMRIRGYDTTRTQNGRWRCDTCFFVTTTRQFSSEEHAVRTSSRWMWLAMVRGWFAARRYALSICAKPGEREALGWL